MVCVCAQMDFMTVKMTHNANNVIRPVPLVTPMEKTSV
jgi:hypothetical protein